jgi:hypothetical protein
MGIWWYFAQRKAVRHPDLPRMQKRPFYRLEDDMPLGSVKKAKEDILKT